LNSLHKFAPQHHQTYLSIQAPQPALSKTSMGAPHPSTAEAGESDEEGGRPLKRVKLSLGVDISAPSTAHTEAQCPVAADGDGSGQGGQRLDELHPTKGPTFLTIPQELRDQIYDELF
jgi:hypothetical protein